jgi:hypothetical protein
MNSHATSPLGVFSRCMSRDALECRAAALTFAAHRVGGKLCHEEPANEE